MWALCGDEGRRIYRGFLAPGQRVPLPKGDPAGVYFRHAGRQHVGYWQTKTGMSMSLATVVDKKLMCSGRSNRVCEIWRIAI